MNKGITYRIISEDMQDARLGQHKEEEEKRTRGRAARKEYGRGRTSGGMGSKTVERKAKGEELRSSKVTFSF